MKKLTVNGIIGKTQGVRSAAKPPKKESKKIAQRDLDSAFDFFGLSISVIPAEEFSAPSISNSNSSDGGIIQLLSLHTIKITSPLTIALADVGLSFCLKTTFPS